MCLNLAHIHGKYNICSFFCSYSENIIEITAFAISYPTPVNLTFLGEHYGLGGQGIFQGGLGDAGQVRERSRENPRSSQVRAARLVAPLNKNNAHNFTAAQLHVVSFLKMKVFSDDHYIAPELSHYTARDFIVVAVSSDAHYIIANCT